MDTKASLEALAKMSPIDVIERDNAEFELNYRLGQRKRIKELDDEKLKEEYFSEVAKEVDLRVSVFDLLKEEIEKRKLITLPQKNKYPDMDIQ